jgi:hypothetical protein
LLTYKVPRKPTAARVYVWRKLKRLGALALQDAAWVLPATSQTREHFQWLAAEIEEMDGEASLWESRLLMNGHESRLMKHFSSQAESAYQEILAGLRRKRPDLVALSKRYQQAQATDYFHCTLGKQVREALVRAAKGADAS